MSAFSLFAAAAPDPLEHVSEHRIHAIEAHLGPLTPDGVITLLSDQIVMMLVAGVLLALFLPLMVRSRRGKDEVGRLVPTGSANLIESICAYFRDNIARPALGPYTDRFIPYVWTVFFFVLAMNLLGMIPFGAVTPLFGGHIGGTATGNIWVTGALAVVSLLMWIVNGLRLGGKQFIAHLCPGPLWLAPLLVPLEILGFFFKAFALCVRLFANMVAGHILLAVLLGFILSAGSASMIAGFGLSVPVVLFSVGISLLEVFVAFLQAFIFTFLTVLFLGQSIVFHHGDDHGEAHAH